MEISKAASESAYWNPGAVLPYDLKLEEVKAAVSDVYELLHTLNRGLIAGGQQILEAIVLGNTFSGMLSEFIVRSLARHSTTLARNERVGGHPDLLPKAHYQTFSVLKGEVGIEVKTSRQPGGWQAHNPERCWVMIFRYELAEMEPWKPTRFVEILCAELTKKDWSLAERKKTSRRTRTVSINSSGLLKLRKNFLYREPAYEVRAR